MGLEGGGGEAAGKGLDIVVFDFVFHDGDDGSGVEYHTERDAVKSYKDWPQDLVAPHHFLVTAEKTALVYDALKVDQLGSKSIAFPQSLV